MHSAYYRTELYLAGLHPEISFWEEVVETAEVIELAQEGARTERNNQTRQYYDTQRNNNRRTDKVKEKNKWNNIPRTKHRPRGRGPVTLKEEVREFLGNVQPQRPRFVKKPGKLSPKEMEEYRAEGKCFGCGSKEHLARNCPTKNSVHSKKKSGPPGRKFQPFKTASMHVDLEETERLNSLAETTASTSNIELGMMSWDDMEDTSDSNFGIESLSDTGGSEVDSIPDLQEVEDSETDSLPDLRDASDSEVDSIADPDDLYEAESASLPDLNTVSDSDGESTYYGSEAGDAVYPFQEVENEEEFSDIDNSSSDEITEENIRLLFKQYKELGGITSRQQMEYETIFRQVPDAIDEWSDCPDNDSIDEICEIRPPMEVIPDHSRRFGDPVARRMDFLLNRSAPYPGDDLDTILRPIFGGERFYCHRSDDPEFYSINDTLYQLVEDRPGVLIHRDIVETPDFDLVNWYRHWTMRNAGISRPKKV
ncbi:hypothetical protein K435DRAFT_794590 [Dendrothele bispora CBS 962.96]|uniref:CCHC-type domain-containing protein n=1 Tax=Dendrothele bispora (strain CBS 962.96) TaxID=1314807 RepID=A0A4S8MC60_DENBC|nr:hypothetical protein K435DRAFT_794590 [Dendrothele bispora CBS 962.96]